MEEQIINSKIVLNCVLGNCEDGESRRAVLGNVQEITKIAEINRLRYNAGSKSIVARYIFSFLSWMPCVLRNHPSFTSPWNYGAFVMRSYSQYEFNTESFVHPLLN